MFAQPVIPSWWQPGPLPLPPTGDPLDSYGTFGKPKPQPYFDCTWVREIDGRLRFPQKRKRRKPRPRPTAETDVTDPETLRPYREPGLATRDDQPERLKKRKRRRLHPPTDKSEVDVSALLSVELPTRVLDQEAHTVSRSPPPNVFTNSDTRATLLSADRRYHPGIECSPTEAGSSPANQLGSIGRPAISLPLRQLNRSPSPRAPLQTSPIQSSQLFPSGDSEETFLEPDSSSYGTIVQRSFDSIPEDDALPEPGKTLTRAQTVQLSRIFEPQSPPYRGRLNCSACDVNLENDKAMYRSTCALNPEASVHMQTCKRLFSLCDEQFDVLRHVSQGHNVFYTGPAGTGKSTVLKAIVRLCDRLGVDTQVISPTGITALNVRGMTMHSFAGWGVRDLPVKWLEVAACRESTWRRLTGISMLIIDEISMVSNFMLTRLDHVMRSAFHNEKPFGGVQVVITGDFHQLPPVKPFKACITCAHPLETNEADRHTYSCFYCYKSWHEDEKWAFSSPAWDKLDLQYVQLHQIHRQADPQFTKILNGYRIEIQPTDEEEFLLYDHECDVEPDAVRIFCIRRMVDSVNERELQSLKGPEGEFKCHDGYSWKGNQEDYPELAHYWRRQDPKDRDSPFRVFVDDRHRFDDILSVKQGMPVLLPTNLFAKDGLVNGSQGTIVGFEPYNPDKLPRMKRSDKDHHSLEQWILQSDHAKYEEYQVHQFAERATMNWPIVQFKNGIKCTIYPFCSVEEVGPYDHPSLISRTQIPLLAAWAITVHKSQGMTLDQAVIDMDRAWAHGQVYTAMSRVKSLQGLKVDALAFGKATRADERVVRFMREAEWVV